MAMNNITTFSASELIKKSAMTLCHFRKKEWQPVITERMLEGVEQQEEHSVSKLREMKGVYILGNIQISYCFDEIIVMDNESVQVVEHKMIKTGEPEEWFFQYCLIQCALYYSLFRVNPNKDYVTASFYVKQGHEKQYFTFTTKMVTPILYMNNKRYKLKVKKPREFVEFYLLKAGMSLEYETSKEWDANWKFREWEHLGNYIRYKELQ